MKSKTSLVTSVVFLATVLGFVLVVPWADLGISGRVVVLVGPVAVTPMFVARAWLTRPDYGENETVARHVALVVLAPTAAALLGGGVAGYLLYPLHWLLGFVVSLYGGFLLALSVAQWSEQNVFPTSTFGGRDTPVDGTSRVSKTSVVPPLALIVVTLGYVLAVPWAVPGIDERVILLTAPACSVVMLALLAWYTQPEYGGDETVARHVALVVLAPTALAVLVGGVAGYLLYPLHWLLGYLASLYGGPWLALRTAIWSGRNFFPTSTLGIREKPVDGTGE